MKHHIIGRCAVACLVAFSGSASAALSFTPNYSGTTYHTHSNADDVIGFDWASDSRMYYATSTPSFNAGGLYRKDGAASTSLISGSSNFSGASVVSIGSTVYYNDSDFSNQYIRTYETGSGSGTSTITTNFALASDGTSLFTSGSSDFITTNLLSYAGGSLISSVQIGAIPGASGPIAFDAAGNLFYAPGFGDKSIYRWTFAEVSAALSGGPPLSASGHLFADYSSAFASMSGATSMAVDALGNLFVSLTNFSDPSNLVKFNSTGMTNELVGSSASRLGGLNFHEGQLFVASGNEIFTVIPEPSSALMSLLCLGFMLRRKR